jgi:fermentation-respiration switch protein FrsA (DUF1100 family)
MEYIKWIIITVIGLYFILGVLYYMFQNRFIFVRYDLKGKYNLNIDKPHKELLLKSDDGETLHALWIKTNNPKGLIIYFHGNTGSLKRWGKVAAQFTEYGYDVLAPDYRGYGKSTGSPNEKALIKDAILFYKSSLENYNEDQIIIYGRSLGSGVAVQLAAKFNPKMLILETPFSSLLNVAYSQVPIFPYKMMLKHHFRSDRHIRNVKCPIVIMHGTRDSQVYYKSALKLYAKVSERDNVVFHTFEGGDHNNLSTYSKYNKLLSDILVDAD